MSEHQLKGREFGTCDQEILRHLEYIELQNDVQTAYLRQILKVVESLATPALPTGAKISQVRKGESMAITGVQAGAATPSVFEVDPTGSSNPGASANPPFPAGSTATWSASDSAVVLVPSTTNPAQVQVSVPATDTNASFTLSVSVQMPTPTGGTAPAPIVASATVPIIPAAAPVPTGAVINQIS